MQVNTESWSYNYIFSNKIEYLYVGLGVGVYVPIFDQLHTEFGIAHQIALKRSFERNNRLPTVENKGSISDIEKGRSFLFGSLTYDIYLYKKMGLNLGVGMQSFLNPYPDGLSYVYGWDDIKVNSTDNFPSGISTMYIINVGFIYNFN